LNRFTFRIRVDSSNSGATRPGVAGRIGISLFFLVWLAIPTAMLVFIARDTWKNAQTWRWREVQCTIIRSDVETSGSDGNYAFQVEYTYTAGAAGDLEARPARSTVYARGYKGGRDYAEAQLLALRYKAGSTAACYVNPADPRDAVLKRNSLGTAAIMLFPMLFIAVGGGGLWFTWRGKAGATASISSRSTGNGKASPWIGVVFFGVFAAIGGAVLAAMGTRALNVFSAKSWTAVPATVVSSRVRSHSGDDGTTYSVDVLYRYTVNGREYRSNRYASMGGSSSGYDGKREIVDRLPPGTPVTAYVNPADPTDAVLERGFTWPMLFLLIPGVIVAVGVVGMFYSVRNALRKRYEGQLQVSGSGYDDSRTSRAFTPRRLVDARGPVVLKPRQSPVAKLIAVTFIALFWNSIVSVFLYQVIKGWRTGHADACLTVFLIPFVAVGVGLIVGIGYTFLALFNPRAVLVLDRGELALGETAHLRWSLTGRADRVHRLVLSLEGREEATYRRGTSTYTDKNTFFTLDLIDTASSTEIPEGKAEIPVPADMMHSFTAANNKIIWVLKVQGHIAGWPDVKDEYPLTIAPAAAAGSAPTAPAEPSEPEEATWNA
jgi:hypothetical protein